MSRCEIITADVLDGLRSLPDASVHCVITSPPYWSLRDYGVPGQLGLEPTPQAHVSAIVDVFREVWRVLRGDGVVWINYGDCYVSNPAKGASGQGKESAYLGGIESTRQTRRGNNVPQTKNPNVYYPSAAPHRNPVPGLKPKDLVMMPHRIAIALQDAGWWVRSASPWVKRSAMPESVTDRPTSAVEYMFLLAKSERYFFDAFAVRRGQVESSVARLAQNVHAQVGSERANGGAKSNGTMKAVGERMGHANTTIPYGDRDGEQEGASSRHGTALEATTGRGTRAWRNSDLWFDSVGMLMLGEEIVGFDVNPAGFKDAHFATYPEKLVTPCVLAGTSEKGVCSICGAPWVRIFVPGKRAEGGAEYRPGDAHGATTRRAPKGGQKEWDKRTPGYVDGWKRSCKCATEEVVPATILDPFCGSGTTGVVALQYGRNFVGIELNPEYVTLAEKRLAPHIAQELLPL